MGARRQKLRNRSGLRHYLLRSASVGAMVTALGASVAQAGQLDVLHGVTNIANAAIAARAPSPGAAAGTYGNLNASNQAGMAAASER